MHACRKDTAQLEIELGLLKLQRKISWKGNTNLLKRVENYIFDLEHDGEIYKSIKSIESQIARAKFNLECLKCFIHWNEITEMQICFIFYGILHGYSVEKWVRPALSRVRLKDIKEAYHSLNAKYHIFK